MTAQTEAKRIVNIFMPYAHTNWSNLTGFDQESNVRNAKKCALLHVDGIEKALTDYGRDSDQLQNMDSEFRWLDSIRSEIEKL